VSKAKVVVDGETLLDDDLTTWQQKPPAFLAELADKKSRPSVHVQAIGVALANSLIRSLPVSIEVTTGTDGWVMRVSH
jgi:hypothetical protein